MPTARALIADAFSILNVFQPGQLIPAAQSSFAFRWLNDMIGQWALQQGTIPAVTREIWPLTAGRGGPSDLYTYGPGGDFNTTKAPTQSSFLGATLQLGGSTPQNTVYIPRALLTDDAWIAIQLPEMQNSQFTEVWYNPTYTSGLGQIGLWPVPNTSENALVLWRQVQLAKFADLDTDVTLPEGYDQAIKYELAFLLATPFGRSFPAEADVIRKLAKTNIKYGNFKLTDLPVDPMFTRDHRAGYNINTGTGS